jgi:hypothetical protein
MVIATPIWANDAEDRNNIAIASSNGRMNRLRIRDYLLLIVPRRLRDRAVAGRWCSMSSEQY